MLTKRGYQNITFIEKPLAYYYEPHKYFNYQTLLLKTLIEKNIS